MRENSLLTFNDFKFSRLGQKCAIHPAFLKMGIDVDEVRISGSSRRCIEFLRAVSALVVSFQWSPQTACNSTKNHTTNKAAGTSLARTFHTVLDRHVTFLDQCRPLPVTIRNVVQFLKQVLVRLESITSPDEVGTDHSWHLWLQPVFLTQWSDIIWLGGFKQAITNEASLPNADFSQKWSFTSYDVNGEVLTNDTGLTRLLNKCLQIIFSNLFL